MDKAPDAFRTISEVADELDIPQHVLRFWESRFPQIKPMKRAGGRRYYRPDDVDLLRGIRHLLYGEGYTIRGVQRILREQGPKIRAGGVAAGRGATRRAAGRRDAGGGRAIGARRRRADAVRPAEGAVGARRRGRSAGREPPSLPRPAPPAPHLTRDNVRRLQSALHEMRECRRLIDQALKDEAA